MFCILESLVNPVLEDFRAHLDLTVFGSKPCGFSFAWLNGRAFHQAVIIATLLGFASKLERVPLNGSSTILAMHILTNFLCNDRNVFEASERGAFGALVDSR